MAQSDVLTWVALAFVAGAYFGALCSVKWCKRVVDKRLRDRVVLDVDEWERLKSLEARARRNVRRVSC